MDVQFQLEDNKGMAYVGTTHAPTARMEFSRAGEHLIIISHTEVGESLRGQGVGRQLLNTIVAYAREHDVRIIPLCPYAKSVFEKDDSIGDVLKS